MVRADIGELAMRAGNFEGPGDLRGRGHYLRDIIAITICAVMCGANDPIEIECFGSAKLPWFRRRLRLPNGVPSHETIGQVLSLLETQRLSEDFGYWLAGVANIYREQPEPVEADALRKKRERDEALSGIDTVSVWTTERGVIFGQNVVHGKSNAGTAIPELLGRMELSSCIVGLDTVGCKRSVPQQIINQGAEYALTVQTSESRLHQKIRESFSVVRRVDQDSPDGEFAETVNLDNGGVENRRCWSISEESELAWIQDQRFWPSLRSVAMVQAERHLGEFSSRRRRYYISSLPGDASQLVRAVSDRWEIGNAVHWTLGINQLPGRNQKGWENEANNLALLRQLTQSMIAKEGSAGSVEVKRKRAGWDDEFLERIFSRDEPVVQPYREAIHELTIQERRAMLTTSG